MSNGIAPKQIMLLPGANIGGGQLALFEGVPFHWPASLELEAPLPAAEDNPGHAAIPGQTVLFASREGAVIQQEEVV